MGRTRREDERPFSLFRDGSEPPNKRVNLSVRPVTARAGHALSAPAWPARYLGMQVAFVLPLSMPLLLPVALYRLNWFYPGIMILLGAHYLPFVFLYGMRMFAVLAALVAGGGMIVAMYVSSSFRVGAWYTGASLLLFAGVGRAIVRREVSAGAAPELRNA